MLSPFEIPSSVNTALKKQKQYPVPMIGEHERSILLSAQRLHRVYLRRTQRRQARCGRCNRQQHHAH